MLINILALATGASFGIVNVLISKLVESNPAADNSSLVVTSCNKTEQEFPLIFTIDTNEASWVGECKNQVSFVCPFYILYITFIESFIFI